MARKTRAITIPSTKLNWVWASWRFHPINHSSTKPENTAPDSFVGAVLGSGANDQFTLIALKNYSAGGSHLRPPLNISLLWRLFRVVSLNFCNVRPIGGLLKANLRR